MIIKKNIVLIIAAFATCVFANSLKAQVYNSIYSMYGLGQLSDNSFGINRSLGGTGIAFQSGRSVNYLNPASYIGIVPNSVILEAGVYGVNNKSKDRKDSQTTKDINFSYFSTSFYFAKWWTFSLGIVPLSSIDYEISSTAEIEGETGTYEKEYTGSGGLSRIYFGSSFKVYKGLLVGLNANFISGPNTLTETVVGNDNFEGYELETKRTVSDFYLDYGLQYFIKDNDWLYTVGLIYGGSKTLNTDVDVQFSYSDETIELEEDDDLDLKVPEKFGIGLSVKKGSNFRAGLDYEWNNWSSVDFSNPNLDTKNSSRFSLGVEYSPDQDYRASWWKRLYYRAGGNYKNSYLEIDNTRINSMGLTLGIGIPYDNTSMINLSVEYGEEGTLSNGLIKNTYWGFYLNVSLHQFWFQRLTTR
ncbi:MAG: hypothetical protein PVH88_16355 [Ignavibacteria bacterium]